MNFLTLVTEVIQGCRVEALGVKVFGPKGTLSTIWYADGYIILSSYSANVPPSRDAVIVSPLPQDEGMRMRLNQ